MDDDGLELRDGIEAKVVIHQLEKTLAVIRKADPERIVTLGGECSVSVAPFSELARRYGDDLAIVWIDSNPDIGTPASRYPGFHAMVVGVLTGHADPDVLRLLPAIVSPDRVALVGLHAWTDDDIPNVAEWGHPLIQPRRRADYDTAAAGLARGDGLLPRGDPLRVGARRRAERTDQRAGAARRQQPLTRPPTSSDSRSPSSSPSRSCTYSRS
jgi:Arginase family